MNDPVPSSPPPMVSAPRFGSFRPLVLAAVGLIGLGACAWWWSSAHDRGATARPRVAVVGFAPPSGAANDLWSPAEVTALTDAVIARLVDGGAVDVLERDAVMRIFTEQGMDSAAHATPAAAARAGRVLQADYVVLGSVAEAREDQVAEALPYGAGVERTSQARAGIDVRVVEVETSRIVGAGRAQLDDVASAVGAPIDARERRAQLARAAAVRVAERVVDAVVPTAVGAVVDGEVQLTRGSTAGVAPGDRFAVLPSAGAGAPPLAEIEVTRVGPTWATARVLTRRGDVAPGDECQLVSRRPAPPPLARTDPLAERW